MKKVKIWYLILSLYFYFTFSIKHLEVITYIVAYSIPCVYILLNFKLVLNLIGNIKLLYSKYSFVLLYILMIITIAAPLFHGTYDLSYLSTIMSIIRTLIKTMFLLIVFLKIHKEDATLELFSKYFILSCCLYVFSTTIMIIFPEIKMFWMNIVANSERDYILSQQYNYSTRYGLMGFSAYKHAFMCSFAIIFNINLILKNKFDFLNFFTLVVLLTGTAFYGRIGLMASIFYIGILMLVLFRKNILSIFLILGSCIILLAIVLSISQKNDMISYWFNWAFAPFINFIESGSFSTGSSHTVLNEMIFMPSEKTILFGDGYYTEVGTNSYYMHTDVGFMRQILFYGLIPTIMAYLMTLFPIIDIYINKKVSNYKEYFIFPILLTVQLIVFEIKGEIFYTMFPIILPFAILAIINNTKNKRSI